ncbi:MAG: hypothetical protein DWQ20_06845, partial [Actinobacteria bacterium]
AWFLMGVFSVGSLEPVIWVSALNGLLVAGYTAFLFGQAEGRDLWQSPILLWHMIASALAVGGGASLIPALVSDALSDAVDPFAWVMVIGAVTVGMMTLTEMLGSHPTTNAEAAFHHMTKGEFAGQWWWGQFLLIPVPIFAGLFVVVGGAIIAGVVGGIAAMAGVFLADDAFVKAGQSVPLS